MAKRSRKQPRYPEAMFDWHDNEMTLAAATNISRSIITDILAGRRRISLGNVRKFADYFRISPGAFVSPEPETATSRRKA